jgi:hypothetical protein
VQRAQGYQVNPVAEQAGQFVGELLDFPAQPPTGPQRVEDVDVAVWLRVTAGARAEHLQLGDPVPVADDSQALLIDVNAWNDHHDPRLTPEQRLVRDNDRECTWLTRASSPAAWLARANGTSLSAPLSSGWLRTRTQPNLPLCDYYRLRVGPNPVAYIVHGDLIIRPSHGAGTGQGSW